MMKMTAANCDLIVNRLSKVHDIVRECLLRSMINYEMRERLLHSLYVLNDYVNTIEMEAEKARLAETQLDQ